jgi:hypothetical protein
MAPRRAPSNTGADSRSRSARGVITTFSNSSEQTNTAPPGATIIVIGLTSRNARSLGRAAGGWSTATVILPVVAVTVAPCPPEPSPAGRRPRTVRSATSTLHLVLPRVALHAARLGHRSARVRPELIADSGARVQPRWCRHACGSRLRAAALQGGAARAWHGGMRLDRGGGARSSEWTIACDPTSRSALGGFAARVVAQRGLVGGAQLIACTRCVGVGARDAEVELAQFVHDGRHQLGAPVAKQFGADP